MAVKIPLRLAGIDLRQVDAYERIPAKLAELSFEARGGVNVAVLYTDAPSPAAEAVSWACLIAQCIPGVEVVEVHDELVSIADIAARCDVAPEAVRLWAAGRRRTASRPFPAPREVVGTGSGGKGMSIYSWADVVAWVRDVVRFDPDEGITYLDARRRARLNAELADMADRGERSSWRPIAESTCELTASTRPVMTPPSAVLRQQAGSLVARMDELLDDERSSFLRSDKAVRR